MMTGWQEEYCASCVARLNFVLSFFPFFFLSFFFLIVPFHSPLWCVCNFRMVSRACNALAFNPEDPRLLACALDKVMYWGPPTANRPNVLSYIPHALSLPHRCFHCILYPDYRYPDSLIQHISFVPCPATKYLLCSVLSSHEYAVTLSFLFLPFLALCALSDSQ